MHYGNWAFSTNNKRTIEAVGNAKRLLGQRDGFSPIDVKQLNKVYNCKGYENVKVPPPKGTISILFHLITQQSQIGLLRAPCFAIHQVPSNYNRIQSWQAGFCKTGGNYTTMFWNRCFQESFSEYRISQRMDREGTLTAVPFFFVYKYLFIKEVFMNS